MVVVELLRLQRGRPNSARKECSGGQQGQTVKEGIWHKIILVMTKQLQVLEIQKGSIMLDQRS